LCVQVTKQSADIAAAPLPAAAASEADDALRGSQHSRWDSRVSIEVQVSCGSRSKQELGRVVAARYNVCSCQVSIISAFVSALSSWHAAVAISFDLPQRKPHLGQLNLRRPGHEQVWAEVGQLM
jgi:hypothetical protein